MLGTRGERATVTRISFPRCRRLWRHYFVGTDAIIFVVDSSDRHRIDLARDEIHKLLGEQELDDAVLLVYANKQDLPGAAPAASLVDQLELKAARGHKWYIQACCGTTGDGLYEGLDWLSSTLASQKK